MRCSVDTWICIDLDDSGALRRMQASTSASDP
jgi:hypothetical protein